MSTYAHISNGLVFELITPPAPIAECYSPAFVAALVDVTQTVPPPQIGWTATQTAGAWSFAAPIVAPPTVAQLCATALSSGCRIVSTGTPALSGTYAVDPGSTADLSAVVQMIQVNNNAFPDGMTALPWQDLTGTAHVFPTAASFVGFGQALANYVLGWKLYGLGLSQTQPAQPVTIP